MEVHSVVEDIAVDVLQYKSILQNIPDSLFQQHPPGGGWSYSEVYQHSFDTGMLAMEAIALILNGKGQDGKITRVGAAILAAGGFPTGIRFKMPEMLAGRLKKITRSEAKTLMATFEQTLERMHPALADAPPAMTIAHPRLGAFNAMEWLRFTQIHLSHHLQQIDRIRMMLCASPDN